MGREVRRVPSYWKHPKGSNGNYIPLHGRSFKEAEAEWLEGKRQWGAGFVEDYSKWDPQNPGAAKQWRPKDGDDDGSWEDYSGERPQPHEYMPDWPEEERTHLRMYEDTSEGTPISPPMATPEELARWLADNDASAFGGMTATYEQWLSMCRVGWAPSAVMTGGVIDSGVAATAEIALDHMEEK